MDQQLYMNLTIYLYELSTKLDKIICFFFISFQLYPAAPSNAINPRMNYFYHKMCFLFALKSSHWVPGTLPPHQSTEYNEAPEKRDELC